eukprot:m.162839 g.162839  ORF g.162839 m.162839 type:complete len:544 (+) comp17098_c0_seq1:169-1800(+)
MARLLLLLLLLPILCVVTAQAEDLADIDTPLGRICMLYDERWGALPTDTRLLVASEPSTGCTNNTANATNAASFKGRVVLFERGDCLFATKYAIAQSAGALGVVIWNSDPNADVVAPQPANVSGFPPAGSLVFMGMVSFSDGQKLLGVAKNNQSVTFGRVSDVLFDANTVVFSLMTLICIVGGICWSNYPELRKCLGGGDTGTMQSSNSSQAAQDSSNTGSGDQVSFSGRHVLIFLGVACILLLLLYFLYKYLVYIIIGIFTLVGSVGLARILDLALARVACLSPQIALPGFGPTPWSSIVATLVGFTVGITWAICRHSHSAWIAQDLLGMAFLTSTIQSLTLPSVRVATMLMVLFLCYDVFFVFITPLFTRNHDSVMVTAATGGSASSETLPLVLRLPRFSAPACDQGFSMLGFGDVIIPSLLVSLCLRFDCLCRLAGKRSPVSWLRFPYAAASLLAYMCGLWTTYMALALSRMAQPALLYLVPWTLITVTVMAWRCNDLDVLWRGDFDSLATQSFRRLPTVATSADDEDERDGAPLIVATE